MAAEVNFSSLVYPRIVWIRFVFMCILLQISFTEIKNTYSNQNINLIITQMKRMSYEVREIEKYIHGAKSAVNLVANITGVSGIK